MKRPHLVFVLLMTLAMTSISAFAQPAKATESTFVAMIGMVNSYGGQPAYGWLGVFAEIGQWAEAGVFWTLAEPTITSFPASLTVYAARLNETIAVELDHPGTNFYVEGLWDVWNITFTYDGSQNLVGKTMELIVDDGPGALSVTNAWTMFTVSISGIELVAGIVLQHCIKTAEIPRGDWNWDFTIDIFDLVHVAKAYGNTPGIRNYDFDIDFNYDFVVDIYDLTTLAANLGESY